MAREAIRARDLPGRAEEKAERLAHEARGKARQGSVEGSTFESLSAKQKDVLLKQLAIQAGLIEDSDDE